MKIGWLFKKIAILLVVAVMSVVLVGSQAVWAESEEEGRKQQCATILKSFCPPDDGNGDGEKTIKDIIIFVISVLSIGGGLLGTVGIVICGYMIMTAKDNEQQVTAAKKRLFDIVIGIVVWALGALLITLLIPDQEAADYIHGGSAETTEDSE